MESLICVTLLAQSGLKYCKNFIVITNPYEPIIVSSCDRYNRLFLNGRGHRFRYPHL